MTDKQVVLVTGVADYWGARVATRLASESDLHVIGLDTEPPPDGANGLDFIQADFRNPLLVDLLKVEGVDTVCHLKFVEGAERNEAAFDQNVMGTMKFFGACAEAAVSKIVIKSSTSVYGAHPDNSAFLTEEMPLRGSRRLGHIRDLIEIEAFVNGFRGQSPKTAVTVLRFVNIVGLTAQTPMTRFLKLQSPPILLGFDPMMQLIHEDDVVEALAHAILNDVPGVFNVGADGAMPLSRILRLARKVPTQIFHPLAYRSKELLRGSRFQTGKFVPFEWDYLRYPWVTDLTQMREEMGFFPLYMADETMREFVGQRQLEEDGSKPEALAYDEQRLHDIIERRRRTRERESTAGEDV